MCLIIQHFRFSNTPSPTHTLQKGAEQNYTKRGALLGWGKDVYKLPVQYQKSVSSQNILSKVYSIGPSQRAANRLIQSFQRSQTHKLAISWFCLPGARATWSGQLNRLELGMPRSPDDHRAAPLQNSTSLALSVKGVCSERRSLQCHGRENTSACAKCHPGLLTLRNRSPRKPRYFLRVIVNTSCSLEKQVLKIYQILRKQEAEDSEALVQTDWDDRHMEGC